MSTEWSRRVQFLVALAFSFVCPANADTEEAGRDIRLAPYVFLANLDGEASVGQVSASVSLKAPDLFGDTNAGVMGYGQYLFGEAFVYGEGIAMDYHDASFEQLYNADVRSSVFFIEAGGGKIWRPDVLGGTGTVSLYGGVRYVNIDADVALGGLSMRGAAEWVDPVAGLIVEHPIGDKWTVLAKVDAAGFGMGGSRYASAAMMLERLITTHMDGVVGWRIADQDYHSRRDTLALNLQASGPQLGLVVHF